MDEVSVSVVDPEDHVAWTDCAQCMPWDLKARVPCRLGPSAARVASIFSFLAQCGTRPNMVRKKCQPLVEYLLSFPETEKGGRNR